MAIATGFVCGMIVFPYIGVPAGAFIGLIVSQIVVFSYYAGKRRGKFELQFLWFQRKKEIRESIAKTIGYIGCFRQSIAEMGEVSWSKGEKYESILKDEIDDSFKFLLHQKLGLLAKKDRNYKKAISCLEKCIDTKPFDMLSHFLLAQCFEREGLGEKAIAYYKTASRESGAKSTCLQKHIDCQVERVEKKGPSKKPPNPGLMHSGMGR
jgi:tetratricopeptide (TPR) repeat protein